MEYKKNKKGYYRTSFSVTNFKGEKERIEIMDKDLDAFLEKLHRAKYEHEKGIATVNGNSTVAKWAYEWLETYKVDILPKQKQRYKGIINNYIVPKIGAMHLKDVKQHHIQQVLNACKDMSKSHISVLYNALNGIFSKAVHCDMIAKNPCLGADKPNGTQGAMRALTSYEERIFLKVVNKHHRGIMFKLILKCGLRPGEVRALNVDRIDLKAKILTVEGAVESGSKRIKETKTKSGERKVPIPDDFIDELKAALPKSGLAFPSRETGGVLSACSFMRSWHSFKRLMDIEAGAKLYRNAIVEPIIDEAIVPYYLRHTYCTHLAEKGVDIRVAQYLMGHSDIGVTANIYTHVEQNTKMLTQAANLINSKPKKRVFRCANISTLVNT